MTQQDRKPRGRNVLLAVIAAALAIALALAVRTYDINFWPTDSYHPYRLTASKLFELPYFSKMHTVPQEPLNQLNMHGKETLILGIAIFQKVLHDTERLYPNVLLLILATAFSSILLFVTLRRRFNTPTAVLGFILFTGCFWPYMYVLQGAHQPLCLMNFLLTVFLLQKAGQRRMLYLPAGIACGLTLFSSPTSLLYLPCAVFFIRMEGAEDRRPFSRREWAAHGLLFALGMAVVTALFVYPDPLQYIADWKEFLSYNQTNNHFRAYRASVLPLLPYPYQLDLPVSAFRGAGWVWVWRYAFLMMPVLFPLGVIAGAYLVHQSRRKIWLLLFVLAGVSTPLLIEVAQAAQFGRNYFSWLLGIIGVICAAAFLAQQNIKQPAERSRGMIIALLVLAAHVGWNAAVFLTDILPSRMATTDLRSWLRDRRVTELRTYREHPYLQNTMEVLNNPRFADKISFQPIDSIAQPTEGLILIPPSSGDLIWGDCSRGNFQGDPLLERLYDEGLIHRMAAASFRPFAASRFWHQEEEVCTYKDLGLGLTDWKDVSRKQIYLLDARLIQQALGSKR